MDGKHWMIPGTAAFSHLPQEVAVILRRECGVVRISHATVCRQFQRQALVRAAKGRSSHIVRCAARLGGSAWRQATEQSESSPVNPLLPQAAMSVELN